MCSPVLPSWIRWHAFSYIFLDAEGTTRKTERRKWLTHQKISLSPAFNMGTMFKMQVTSVLKTANILSQMANKVPKTKWNWTVPSPGPITILPIYCRGGKKKQGRKPGHPYSRWSGKYRFSAFDYGEKHLNSRGNSAGSSCFTFIPYIQALAFKPRNSNPLR